MSSWILCRAFVAPDNESTFWSESSVGKSQKNPIKYVHFYESKHKDISVGKYYLRKEYRSLSD